MSRSLSPASRRALVASIALAAVTLTAGACSKTNEPASVSAQSSGGTGTTVGTSVGTSSTTAGDETATDPGESSQGGSSDGGGSTGGATGGNSGGNTGGNSGGGSNGGGTKTPSVTGVSGPSSVGCTAPTGTMTITITYKVANAKNIEYLQPGSARPGAGPATGSVMVNFDCSQTSQVYKIRAFNDFASNGSDAKDPSPYQSVTVQRGTITGSTTTTKVTSNSSTTTSSSAPATTTTKP